MTRLEKMKQRDAHHLKLLNEFIRVHGWSKFRVNIVYRRATLGQWVLRQLIKYKDHDLYASLQAELEQIPYWSWSIRVSKELEVAEIAKEYIAKYGSVEINVSTMYKGFRVGPWVVRQRHLHNAGKLRSERQKELEKTPGWVWNPRQSRFGRHHKERLTLVEEYVAKMGKASFGAVTIYRGQAIGAWVSRLKMANKRAQGDPKLKRRLQRLGVWDRAPDRTATNAKVRALKQHIHKYGWQDLTKTKVGNMSLQRWVAVNRQRKRKGEMSDWLKAELESVPGWRW